MTLLMKQLGMYITNYPTYTQIINLFSLTLIESFEVK